jgi:hypothetical protein
MKLVSLGTVLIALLLSVYILLSVSETQQKPIHLQCCTKMENLTAATHLCSVSYTDVKENSTKETTVLEATLASKVV